MTPSHSSSLQVAAAALCCFCAGALYGWSALIPIAERNLIESTSQAGLIFSLAIVSFTVAVFIAPRLAAGLQQLTGCAVFGFIGAICLYFASLSTTYLAFVASFSAGFGVASGAIYINALSVAAASPHPKLTTPIVVASFGLGGAIFGPFWRWLAAHGWDMSALLPASAALFISAILCIITSTNSISVIAPSKLSIDRASKTTHAAINQPTLLLLIWFTFGFGSMGGLMVLGLASKIVDVVGGSVLVSTIAVAAVAIANTAGRLAVSLITLRYSPIHSVITATIFISIGLAILAVVLTDSSNAVMVMLALTTIAAGYGVMASAVPTLVRTVYSASSFASVFSIVFCAWGVAGLTAPWVSGVIFDQTGSFLLAVLGALLLTLFALLTALIIKYRLRLTVSGKNATTRQ